MRGEKNSFQTSADRPLLSYVYVSKRVFKNYFETIIFLERSTALVGHGGTLCSPSTQDAEAGGL